MIRRLPILLIACVGCFVGILLIKTDQPAGEQDAIGQQPPVHAASRSTEDSLSIPFAEPPEMRRSEDPSANPLETQPRLPAPDAKQALGPAFETATVESLVEERDRLQSQLSAVADPLFDELFDAGRAEFISIEQRYEGRKEDGTDICAIRYVPGRGLFRIVLPRSEHSDLYALKDQVLALNALIFRKQRDLRLAEAAAPK